MTKICTKCGIEKDIDEFYDRIDRPSKKRSHCKLCCNIKTNEYYFNNKEKFKIMKKNWSNKNKEKIQSYSKKHYLLNKNEKIKTQNIQRKEKYKTDKIFKLNKLIGSSFYHLLKNSIIKNKNSIFKYTGISIDIYINQLKKYQYFKNYFEKESSIEIDHIIPKSAYDFNNPDDIKKCWHPKNLRLVKSKKNMEKHSKIDFNLIKKHQIEHLLPEKLQNAI